MLELSSGVRATLVLGLAALTVVTITRATPAIPSVRLHQAALPGTAPLHAFIGRGGALRSRGTAAKLDATLASLLPHVAELPPAHALAVLHGLNPAVRYKLSAVTGQPLVLIDAVTLGETAQLEQALGRLGLEHAAAYGNDVGGWLPLSQLASAAGLANLHGLRAAMMRRRTGLVTSQGGFAQGSARAAQQPHRSRWHWRHGRRAVRQLQLLRVYDRPAAACRLRSQRFRARRLPRYGRRR